VHPYYVGTQAHPELTSRPLRAHPMFVGLVYAALRRADPTFDAPLVFPEPVVGVSGRGRGAAGTSTANLRA
jgi:hypothetical protein